MITIHVAPALKHIINPEIFYSKIELSFNHPTVNRALNELTFDPRYTKPAHITGLNILAIIRDLNIDVFIGKYTQNIFKWKMFPVNSYTKPSQPDWIYVNTRQVRRRSVSEWEETLWHELVHFADNYSAFRFDHGDNDLSGDDESAPVKLAKYMASIPLELKLLQTA